MKQFLSQTELFKNLSDEEYDLLEKHAEARSFDKHELFYEKDHHPGHLHLLQSGKVKVFDERKITQREEIIQVFSEGDVFDLTAVFIDHPYPLSAKALEAGDIILIEQTALQHLFENSNQFLRNAVRILSRINSQLMEGMSDLSLSTTKERLAKYLLREYHHQKRPSSFRLPLNQSQIASHLGTVREIVSRDLASLKKARVIESKQGEIAVLNPDELSHIAEGYTFHT